MQQSTVSAEQCHHDHGFTIKLPSTNYLSVSLRFMIVCYLRRLNLGFNIDTIRTEHAVSNLLEFISIRFDDQERGKYKS